MQGIRANIVKMRNKGFGDVFLSSIFSEFILFLVSVLIVRKLTKVEYGSYAIAYNIYSYLAVFIGAGLTNGVLQYCSEMRSKDEKERIYKFCSVFGTIFNIVLLIIIPIISGVCLEGRERYYLILMSGWPLIAYLSNYYLVKLRVKKDNRHYMLTNVISISLFFLAAILLTFLLDVEGYVIALYIKHIVSAGLAFGFLRENKKEKVNFIINDTDKKLYIEILKYSLYCCLTNFTSTLMMLLDVTCISCFIGDASIVATYKTATQIPTAMMFVPSSIIIFVYPYLAENNQNWKWLRSKVKMLLLGVFAINFCIASVVFVFAPVIVKILWGEKYMDAVLVLRILTVNFVITGTFNKVYGNLMVAIKKVKVNLAKTVVFSGLNVILNIFLIREYGSTGAAIATVIVSIGSSVFAIVYYYWYMRKKVRMSKCEV